MGAGEYTGTSQAGKGKVACGVLLWFTRSAAPNWRDAVNIKS